MRSKVTAKLETTKRKQILKTNTTTSLIALTKKVQLRKIDDVHLNDDTIKFCIAKHIQVYTSKVDDELTNNTTQTITRIYSTKVIVSRLT